ncbi:cysteine-rich small domain-containing protein [Halosquirtibacter laminarini]|uniref:Cysteine-rich small domain-containing protein n=1 Tax=Halosquirtibacter laminarini TaxID=3374600 RepID=A0AC61NMP2_9BACT|nr:cysteine-rich small domain-containing protein [Prolixibacteraceae bacterium]
MRSKCKTENYKFSQHKACEFFPCHKVKDDSTFNCLFCYCPLYMLKDQCGGSFKYTNGVKDCSDCLLPHSPKAFDHVMSKMGDIIAIGSQKVETSDK